jgi:hypothetical protein
LAKLLSRALAAVAVLCVSFAHAAVESKSTHTTYQVRRGSTNLPPAPTSEAECISRAHQAADTEGLTRESGANDFQCHKVLHVLTKFGPNRTCGDKPADLQEQRTCPAGTVGTWLQDRVYTLQPYPDCWVLGEWTPSVPPDGMCAPADSDGDGVPDQADECPTVHAMTPNGCPASPPEQLAAPTNVLAQGISTSSIRVTWDAVPGAAAYSLRRCIGATCEPMDRTQLMCTAATEAMHVTLPAGITVSYRVVASETAACSDLGEPSAIAAGTTLSVTPTTGIATLSWTPPTQNTDGTPITGLAGYRISYGQSANALAQTVQVANPGATSYTVTSLPAGVWYFAIRAYTSVGTQSDQSNIVSKSIQ